MELIAALFDFRLGMIRFFWRVRCCAQLKLAASGKTDEYSDE